MNALDFMQHIQTQDASKTMNTLVNKVVMLTIHSCYCLLLIEMACFVSVVLKFLYCCSPIKIYTGFMSHTEEAANGQSNSKRH